jgi:hypothetical protein
LMDLEAQIGTRQAELADLTAKTNDAQQLLALRDQAVAQAQQAQQWIVQSQDELLQLKGERERQEVLRQHLAAEESELVSIQDERNKLVGENAHLVATNQGLTQQNSATQVETEKLKGQQQGLREDLKKLEITAQEVRVQLAGEENRLQQIRQQTDESSRTLQEIEREVAENRSAKIGLEQDLARLDRDVTQRRSDLEANEKQLSDRRQMLQQCEDRLRDLRSEITYAEQTASVVSARLAEVQHRLDAVVTDLKLADLNLSEVRKTTADEEVKVAGLRSEHEALLKTIEALKALAEGLRDELGKVGGGPAEDRYKDLWAPLVFPTLKVATNKTSEQEALERTSQYIKAQRLRFPPRVLHAFHTALKINGISPLVVLAGISGTGKSELPRRYAEGMGIHFVLLAVQPRWDSPQDLFGFYNYLERRYKATELARALVQFERYNNPNWPLPEGWNHSRKDRMLLVLLDEMNLARVEYYFSEFLSKLETRRGVDRNDGRERAKAEIALEMGNIAKNEIRLFPDQNVLFTGTMNEDESTQALSDKVLDRACVLRFGRPRQLGLEQNNGDARATEHGLSYDAWGSWIRESSSRDLHAEQVNGWIAVLNDAMEQLHRPFGHRVAQAIHSYVANYPNWIPDHVKLAMADQIEQRILPKLRGIDVEDARPALEKIRKVIAELEDDRLTNAFQAGYQDQASFIWRGIDRAEE